MANAVVLSPPEQPKAPPADAMWPGALPYGTLLQRHPSFDVKRYECIEDLYAGGFEIQGKAKHYLPKHKFEHDQQYDRRCQTASYMPYFAQIVDAFVSDLFTQPLHVTPAGDKDNPNTPGTVPDKEFYPEFAADADGEGTELESLVGDLLTTAFKHRRAYLQLDMPDVALPDEATRADEDDAGARRVYGYEVCPHDVLDWREAPRGGELQWVILHGQEQERDGVGGDRSTVTETFTAWRGGKDGAEWARWSITYKADEPPKAEAMVARVATGSSTFEKVPILVLELPDGLWVGNKIGPQALEHWRRRSELVAAESASCVEIPVATLGPEIPAVGEGIPAAGENPQRGNDPVAKFRRHGFVVLGSNDDLKFVGPEGKAYEIIDKQLGDVRDGMFAVEHQMAAAIKPTNTAVGRSGLSKQKDQESTAKVLGAVGRIVRKFAVRVYDYVSRARKEDVVWVGHGLDSYEVVDREQVLEESLQIQSVAIPSETFQKEHAKRVAAKLVPNLPPETVAVINDEIDRGVAQHAKEEKAIRTAEVKERTAPPQPQGGDGPPPGGQQEE